ncbi:MAG: hypothetical protein HQM12_11945 [SAR324 cluster bacterium]|nr:hypothetical protein [SAR324 cluster bacterium]
MSKIMIIFVCLGLLLGVVSSCLQEDPEKKEKIQPLSAKEIEASLPPNPLQYINGLKLIQ